jgi:hypothetical protein
LLVSLLSERDLWAGADTYKQLAPQERKPKFKLLHLDVNSELLVPSQELISTTRLNRPPHALLNNIKPKWFQDEIKRTLIEQTLRTLLVANARH